MIGRPEDESYVSDAWVTHPLCTPGGRAMMVRNLLAPEYPRERLAGYYAAVVHVCWYGQHDGTWKVPNLADTHTVRMLTACDHVLILTGPRLGDAWFEMLQRWFGAGFTWPVLVTNAAIAEAEAIGRRISEQDFGRPCPPPSRN